jgi:hypothetical protein
MIKLISYSKEDHEFSEIINKQSIYYTQLISEWDRLEENEKDICTHPAIMINWIHAIHVNNKNTPDLMVVLNDDICIGILPFYIRHIYLFYIVIVAKIYSGSSIALQKDILPEVLQKFLTYPFLKNKAPMYIYFDSVDETNNILRLKNIHKISEFNYTRKKIYVSPQLIEKINRKEGSTFRSLSKNNRRLCKIGNVTVSTINDINKISDAVAVATQLEDRCWKKDTHLCLSKNLVKKTFIKNVCNDFFQLNSALIATLNINNVPISILFGIIVKNVCYGLSIAYDEAYASYSPGHLLKYYLFKDYFIKSHIHYYHSLGEVKWELYWKPQEIKTYKLFIFKHIYVGLIIKVNHAIKKIIR